MSSTDQRDGPSRVEREILEILERSEPQPTSLDEFRARLQHRAAPVKSQVGHVQLPDFPPDLLRLLGSLLLAVAAAAVSDFSRLLGLLLAIGSGLALMSLWIPFGPSVPGGAPRWRGQDLRQPPKAFGLFRRDPGSGPRGPRR